MELDGRPRPPGTQLRDDNIEHINDDYVYHYLLLLLVVVVVALVVVVVVVVTCLRLTGRSTFGPDGMPAKYT